MHLRNLVRLALVMLSCAAVSAPAFAQYGGGTGGTSSSGSSGGGGYGNGAAIGAVVGAAAGGAILFLALRNRHKDFIMGCVDASSDQTTMMNDLDKKTYVLLPSDKVTLTPGQRLKLYGKKKDSGGKLSFQARQLAKDYGPCDATSASNAAPTTQ